MRPSRTAAGPPTKGCLSQAAHPGQGRWEEDKPWESFTATQGSACTRQTRDAPAPPPLPRPADSAPKARATTVTWSTRCPWVSPRSQT